MPKPHQSISPLESKPYDEFGLTKREYFSVLILQGLLSSKFTATKQEFVSSSVEIADALIEELDKKTE